MKQMGGLLAKSGRYAALLGALACVLFAGCGGAADGESAVLEFGPSPSAGAAASAQLPTATHAISVKSPVPMPSQRPQKPAPTDTPAMATPGHTPEKTPEPTSALEPAPAQTEEKTKVADGFYFMKLDDSLKKRITGMSFPEKDARIAYGDLRYIGLLYMDFEGNKREGELIVHRKLAREVTEIFLELYRAGYPLASVRLVDDYGEPGDDNKSMAANNTSAFNYRRVTGSSTLSRHSYGAAIDINPLFNPYIVGDRVAPPEAAPYVDRSKDFAGKIDHDDLCYKLFHAAGWSWGGDFKGDKDYQHFSKEVK